MTDHRNYIAKFISEINIQLKRDLVLTYGLSINQEIDTYSIPCEFQILTKTETKPNIAIMGSNKIHEEHCQYSQANKHLVWIDTLESLAMHKNPLAEKYQILSNSIM